MLINRASEMGGFEGEAGENGRHDNSAEYQTANELFELMSRNHNFEPTETESLTTQDLVLLYKNIDIGTRLMSVASDTKNKKPNQRVETIVYNDESDESDVGETYSNDDLRDVFLVNDERLDLINSQPAFENTLCHKFGNFQIRSGLNSEYDKYFIFKDPFIKEKLKNLHPSCNVLENASLLDYICCSRLKDNNNFYMDKIITYVKHTIEQLKRISNGDYLTDRARAKWRADYNEGNNKSRDESLALATSTSIPLRVEQNISCHTTMRDDIVHSEVDVRSLTRHLKKKIILDIPKFIAGSYIFSKQATDSLLFSYKEDIEIRKECKEKAPRVDVVVHLQRSESGHVISSIKILQLNPSVITPKSEILALPYKDDDGLKEETKVVEIIEEDKDSGPKCKKNKIESSEESSDIFNNYSDDTCIGYLFNDEIDMVDGENEFLPSEQDAKEISQNYEDFLNVGTINEHMLTPDELLMMERHLQTPLLEESETDGCVPQKTSKALNKSPIRYRIKSPYENKSHAVEENKRKKLIEIRERREKRKITLTEKCKVFKEKYGKHSTTPQTSNSVTNLSITNKSFYNSIYGYKLDTKQSQSKRQQSNKKENMPIAIPDHCGDDNIKDEEALDQRSQKFVNKSYYLDNPDTEVMRDDLKGTLASNSTESNDLSSKLNILVELMSNSSADLNYDTNLSQRLVGTDEADTNNIKSKSKPKSVTKLVPVNTPTNKVTDSDKGLLKRHVSFNCRKSIGKIYDLININLQKNAFVQNIVQSHSSGTGMTQLSDSGTSLKHVLTSITSCSTFNRPIKSAKQATTSAIVPKVIISNKQQTAKAEVDRFRRSQRNNRRFSANPPTKDIQENPLKAISQLLREFDNVQKTRRSAKESKLKNIRHQLDGKSPTSPVTTKIRSRYDENQKDCDLHVSKSPKSRSVRGASSTRIEQNGSYQSSPIEKSFINEQKMADIIDEVRESRGEAVRGPPKPFSRLNSLAQPKKIYVQAHNEEYKNRYGRTLMGDRLQRLAQQKPERLPNSKLRQKRITSDIKLNAPMKQPSPPLPPSGGSSRIKRSPSSSLEKKETSHNLKKDVTNSENINKMVAVGSCENHHYGSAIRSSPNKLRQAAIASRIPYIPEDLKLGTLSSQTPEEDSSTLGSKIHLIIDRMLPNRKTALKSVKECTENSSESCNDNNKDVVGKNTSIETNSDCLNVQFRDSNVETDVKTAAKTIKASKHINNNKDLSVSDMQKLENALSHLPFGNHQKRLRMRNLTLTPNQSLQQIFLLQSGDASSLFTKPSRSELKVNDCQSQANANSKIITTKNNTDVYMDYNLSNLPMQIATIGYAFPEIKEQIRPDITEVNSIDTTPLELSDDHIINKGNQFEISQNFNEAYPKITPTLNINLAPNKQTVDENKLVPECVDEFVAEQVKHCIRALETDNVKTTISNSDATIATSTDIPATNTVNDTKITNTIEYTTSLDMLVGILNEIKNITACQTRMSYVSKQNDINELETLLNNMVLVDKDNLSDIKCNSKAVMISDDQNASELCHNILDDRICKNLYVQTCVDKEVGTEFLSVEFVNKIVEAQSQFFPMNMTMNHSTNITNSLIGILSEPSSQSLLSLRNLTTTISRSSLSPKRNITEISHENTKKNKTKSVIENEDKTMLHGEDAKCDIRESVVVLMPILSKKKELKGENVDFDVIKMKRDILVTVYSILVLTVFAALSFPNIL